MFLNILCIYRIYCFSWIYLYIGRVEYFACGKPLLEAFHSEERATPGDVIVSSKVWSIIKESFDGIETTNGFMKIKNQIKSFRNKSVKSRNHDNMHVYSDAQKILEKYIPNAVLPYLTRSQNNWSGELRLVTVLFVNIGVNLSNVSTIDKTSLDWIQSVIMAIQKSIYKYEGSLNKFLVDDKGSNVIAVFGVPPLAHYDDATRGLLSALKLLRKMRSLGVTCCIGVTSGLVYTGLLGSGTSREYGVLGDAVNLSARLMAKQKKTETPGVICDITTQELIPSDAPIRFDPMEPFKVKGKSKKIKAFIPRYNEGNSHYIPQSHYFEVSIDSYKSYILKNIDHICNRQKNGYVMLIESMIGTGKTYLLESIVSYYNSKYKEKCHLVWSSGIHYINANCLIWKEIFETLLNRKEFTENRSYRHHVKNIFNAMDNDNELIPYLSLTNDIFGTQFLETEKCSLLNNESRWDKKTELCLKLLQRFSKHKKLILFIDNIQWACKDDWKIFEYIVNMVNNKQSTALNKLYLFIAGHPFMSILYRPRFQDVPTEYIRIRNLLKNKKPYKQLIKINEWNLNNIKQFICEYFAVDDSHPCISSFIYERTGGNPSFITWLCEFIEVNIIHNNDIMLLEMNGNTEINITSEAPLQHPVPTKVHSTLMGYIDRLTSSQVILLKTASVICMGQGSGSLIFDFNSINDVYPIDEYKSSIKNDLISLENISIIKKLTNIQYDTLLALKPSVFVHNHRWMYQSPFLCLLCSVSISSKNDGSNSQNQSLNNNDDDRKNDDTNDNNNNTSSVGSYSKKLVQFYMNRLIIYTYKANKGVKCWSSHEDKSIKVIPFNDKNNQVRLKRLSKHILLIEYMDNIYTLKQKKDVIDELHVALEDCLAIGIMTIDQERELTYPYNIISRNNNELYTFSSGFCRDVIYGLMLLKQRQQLHDNAAKFLQQQWTEHLSKQQSNDYVSDNEFDIPIFTEWQRNVLNRHKDLALKDDTLRRMGSFHQAAPQSSNDKSRKITSPSRFYKTKTIGRSINVSNKKRLAALSNNNNTNKFGQRKSIFTRLRNSLAVSVVPTLNSQRL